MDLNKHFQTYRASLGKDALDGCQQFAKNAPTAQPESYPTVHDYLNLALNNVRTAVDANNVDEYKIWISRHRSGMVALFEKMVDGAVRSIEGTPVLILYTLIHDKGWNWFKFCPASLTVSMTLHKEVPERVDVHWIPRYVTKFEQHWANKPGVAFDADELSQFWSLKGSDNPARVTHPAIEFKLKTPGQKLVRVDVNEKGGAGYYKPISKVNSDDTVVDWSLPLF